MTVSKTSTSLGPRLRAALLALAGAMVVVIVGMLLLDHYVQTHIKEMLVSPVEVKDMGIWLQREAFSRPNMLGIYGSSELTEEQTDRAEEMFSSDPTGFEVFPVGAPGHTTLLMAAKLGSLGDCVRGKKVVIIISPSWFRRAGPIPDQVAGCLSPLQAYQFVRNPLLSDDLKRRFASRLLEYEDAMDLHPVLHAYLKGVAQSGRGSWLWSPVVGACVLGLKWEDHLAVGSATLLESRTKSHVETLPFDEKHEAGWKMLIDPKDKEDAEDLASDEPRKVHSKIPQEDREEEFTKSYEGGKEWDDLKLLLDTLKALEMKPLLIGVPLGGNGLETHGITRQDRDVFYDGLRKACAPYGWPLVEFAEHDMDPGFLKRGTSHFTPKGWLYVNWVLDDFYHDRPIRGAVVDQGNKGGS
jgi:D-alanine transfer protein